MAEEYCRRAFVLAIKDALAVVSGKWKLAIVCALLTGPQGFAELERLLPGISPRMLSRELRELEVNGVICRLSPPRGPARFAKYALTPSGARLQGIIEAMAQWGVDHRAEVLQGPAVKPGGGPG